MTIHIFTPDFKCVKPNFAPFDLAPSFYVNGANVICFYYDTRTNIIESYVNYVIESCNLVYGKIFNLSDYLDGIFKIRALTNLSSRVVQVGIVPANRLRSGVLFEFPEIMKDNRIVFEGTGTSSEVRLDIKE